MTVLPVTTADDPADLARRTAREVARAIQTSRREPFTVALSGGTTPRAMLAELTRIDGVDWSRVEVFQVDERIAPAGHPDRNLTMLDDTLLGRVAVGAAHPMPVEDNDPVAAAADYDAALPGALDLVVLGLGEDGHTASLVPADPVLDVVDRDVAVTDAYRGRRRMTLTYPALARAGTIIWLISGPAKGPALARLLAGDRSIPAGRVRADRARIFTDQPTAAAADRARTVRARERS